MKKILISLVLILLCACSTNDETITNDITSLLNNLDSLSTNRANNSLDYYSYYLPSDMGQIDNLNSEVLTYIDSKIIMSLNVKEIVNSEYYSDEYMKSNGLFNQDYLIYTNSGQYTTINNETKDYVYRLYKKDLMYVIELDTSDLSFIAYSKNYIVDITRHLFIICKSVSVDSELVLSTYSSKDVVDYQKKQIDLFDSVKPSSGSLSDLLTNDAIIGNDASETEPTETEVTSQEIAENQE